MSDREAITRELDQPRNDCGDVTVHFDPRRKSYMLSTAEREWVRSMNIRMMEHRSRTQKPRYSKTRKRFVLFLLMIVPFLIP